MIRNALPRMLLICMIAAVTLGLPMAARSVGVTGTPHDLNTYPGISVQNSEVCKPCHTPHFAQPAQTFLWNHSVNAGASYTLYNSNHATPYPANYVGLDKTSKLCLSCHDGAIAIDSYGGAIGTKFMPSDKVFGNAGDLSAEHPLGLTYPGLSPDGTWTAGSAPGFNDPTASAFSLGGANGNPGVQLVTMPGTTTKGIGCMSCHDPHNQTNGNFLRTSNTSNSICQKCHNM